MKSGRLQYQRPHYYHPLAAPSSGSALLYSLLALLLIATLGIAVSHLSPAASQSALSQNAHDRAAYLALSGLNAWTPGRTGAYTLANGRFTLSQSGPDANGRYSVTCLGTVNTGTDAEANVLTSVTKTGLSPITFTENLDDFPTPILNQTTNNTNAITVYAANTGYTATDGHSNGLNAVTNTATYASGSLVFAKSTGDTYGTIWYTGSRGVCTNGVCGDGLCQSGRCTLGKGLRAYFGFVFSTVDTSRDSRAYGDGFTFTIANATTNNTTTAAGGPAADSRGEYLGYAGPGLSGCGIAAPKLAVEIDVYPNLGHAAPDQVDSRIDHATANHVALVWWGNAGSYDDNVHGLGYNPAYTTDTTTPGYVERTQQHGRNWLEDGAEHSLRLELHRDDATIGGSYHVKVWIDATANGVDDVTRDFTAESPLLDTTTTLSSAEHEALDTILFGWTEGTGGSVQTVAIHDFSLDFRH